MRKQSERCVTKTGIQEEAHERIRDLPRETPCPPCLKILTFLALKQKKAAQKGAAQKI
jgi:hypothetical protein